jgi:hypothetical protein
MKRTFYPNHRGEKEKRRKGEKGKRGKGKERFSSSPLQT